MYIFHLDDECGHRRLFVVTVVLVIIIIAAAATAVRRRHSECTASTMPCLMKEQCVFVPYSTMFEPTSLRYKPSV